MSFSSKSNDYGYIPPGGYYRFQGNLKSAMSALVGPCVCRNNYTINNNNKEFSSLTLASNIFGKFNELIKLIFTLIKN